MIKRAEDYLNGYRFNSKILGIQKYEKEYFDEERFDICEYEIAESDELMSAREKMAEIRGFVNSLPNSDEKLIIYYRYLKGESVERCGELIGFSRTSAFRLRKRALELVARAYDNYEKHEKLAVKA
jgi:DNA-directed RNA polymerase specialized sigma subunit